MEHWKLLIEKKNLFKIANGEFVAPEKCENVLCRCPLVSQCLVYGETLENSLVSIVVPDLDTLLPWAKGLGIEGKVDDLVSDIRVKEGVLKAIHDFGRKGGLLPFEIPKDIMLVTEPFSVENGVLTPTFKLKRNEAVKKYKSLITKMYDNLHMKNQTLASKL